MKSKGILERTEGDTRAGRTGVRWAWHKRTLVALRDRLLAERGERLAAASEPLEPHSQDLADSASDEFDRDLALGNLSAEQGRLFEIEEALQRIRDGTYGVCEETGRPIPAARLKAVPWTRFSRDVEARLEREGRISKPRLGAVRSVRDGEPGDLSGSEPAAGDEAPEADDEFLRPVHVPPGRRVRGTRDEVGRTSQAHGGRDGHLSGRLVDFGTTGARAVGGLPEREVAL